VLFNVVYALLAFPIGIWSDRIGRRKVLIAGYALFILTCISFVFSSSLYWFVFSFVLYGITYAFIVGSERAFASDLAPKKELGTAMGTFHTAIAIIALPSSLIAGWLWEYSSHDSPFIFATFFAFIAMMMLIYSKDLDR
jgi:MFS family permease